MEPDYAAPRLKIANWPTDCRPDCTLCRPLGDRRRRSSVREPYPDPAVGLSLALHLDHLHPADLLRGCHMRAAVGLDVQPDDVHDADLRLVRGNQIRLGP